MLLPSLASGFVQRMGVAKERGGASTGRGVATEIRNKTDGRGTDDPLLHHNNIADRQTKV